MLETQHQTLFIVGFIIYVAFLIFIGWYASKKSNDGSNYLTGGRNLSFLLIFSTIGATMIGTGSSMGATANGFRNGWGGSSYALGCAVAMFLLAFLFAKMREKNFITMAEEAQYYFGGSVAVRKLMGFMMFVAELVFIGSHMNGGSKYLQFVTGLDPVVAKLITLLAFGIYVYIGGYLAVVWTDVVQLGIIIVGFSLIIFRAIPMAGGWEAIEAAYTSAGNTGALAFYGLSSMGVGATISLILASCLGEMGAPTYRTRIYTSKNASVAKKAYIATGFLVLAFSLVPSILGMSAFTLATKNGVAQVINNPDFAFSYLATTVLGPALGLILLISGLSATMSSGDSDAIAGVTILLEDIYPSITGKRIPEEKMKSASRAAVIVTLIFAFLVTLTANDIMSYIGNVLGSLMPGIVVTMIIGRLWKGVTPAAGVASIISGTTFGVLFLGVKPFADMINGIFDGPSIPAAMLVAVVCFGVSLFTKKSELTEEEILKKVLEGRTDLAAESNVIEVETDTITK